MPRKVVSDVLSEARKKEIFAALVNAQDQRMSVEKSRTVLGGIIPWRDLERQALGELKGRVERFVEARYQGQSHEIRIPVTRRRFDSLRSLTAGFHAAHRRLYGFTRRDPVEIVNAVVRVTSTRL